MPLVLPNAWDAASAKVVVAAGFPIVATTSGGVAACLGYEDHEDAPAKEMLAAAKRIAASVDVPVTIDAESGYGMTPSDLVEALLHAGAAGCNLEDSDHSAGRLVEVDRQTDRLAAIREAAAARGYGLVINARIDVFLADGGAQPQGALLDEAVSRARSYRQAGADCVFPILLSDAEVIASFVEAVQMPVNILALPQAPPIAQLAEIGVARVSYGSTFHQRSLREFDASLRDIPR